MFKIRRLDIGGVRKMTFGGLFDSKTLPKKLVCFQLQSQFLVSQMLGMYLLLLRPTSGR